MPYRFHAKLCVCGQLPDPAAGTAALAVTTSTVRKYERSGWLTPVHADRVYYAEAEVKALATKRRGASRPAAIEASVPSAAAAVSTWPATAASNTLQGPACPPWAQFVATRSTPGCSTTVGIRAMRTVQRWQFGRRASWCLAATSSGSGRSHGRLRGAFWVHLLRTRNFSNAGPGWRELL